MNNFLIILVTISCLLVFSSCNTSNKKDEKINSPALPIFGEKKLSGSGNNSDTIYHSVGNFKLTNQFGESIDQNEIVNKIYIADFFFATCQSICPKMSNQLARVQDSIKNQNDILILSHTVNPMHDSVEVLKSYSEKYGAIKGKWHLLTGSKKEIYELAKKDYLVNALEDGESEEGFLHSELFLLIDKQKRVRGLYDGTDSLQVNKLIKEIKLLKDEEKQNKKL